MAPAIAAARKSSLEYRMGVLCNAPFPGADDSYVAPGREDVQDRSARYPAISEDCLDSSPSPE
jgi:hypothetical protein